MTDVSSDVYRQSLVELSCRFRRSWVDMARALVELKQTRTYESWGYSDLYAYCNKELFIRKPTVDKLVGSFETLEQYAPSLLTRDEPEQPIPSYDAVDYFARALSEQQDGDLSVASDRIDDFREAVFEQAKPISSLRREFGAVFFGKSEQQEALERLERTNVSIRRLCGLLTKCAGVSSDRLERATLALEELQSEVQGLIEETRTKVEQEQAELEEAPEVHQDTSMSYSAAHEQLS
ncbi:MAG: hypothetical protein AAF550_03545 [Myxococcota bacterium]